MNDLPPANFHLAPAWSFWTAQLGADSVYAGIALFVLAIIGWAISKQRPALGKIATAAFVVGCVSLFVAMGCLASLFIHNQFEYKYVYSHGGADTSLPYKIASVWTAQQGSFLLWACTSALFGIITIWGTGAYRRWFGAAYSVFLGTLASILAYDSPFALLPGTTAHGHVFIPPDGAGMTPSLQNYWVIIHPPTIFTGFGSLTVLFAYSVAAMLTGDRTDWVRRVRPWTLVSVAVLGLGLCMGGMWAYETQGWGGFWAWDPVENVSFVPWLFCAALTHGLIVQNVKGKWTSANLLLAGLPFLTFVYGTFLTRSGLLDKVSVHSFASMDKSALTLLRTFMVLVALAFTGLFATRGRSVPTANETPEPDTGVRREAFYRFGVLMLSLFATAVALGMSWPVITALRGGQGSAVEERTYHLVIGWFFVPTMLAMAVAPFVSWRNMGRHELWVRVSNVLSLSAGLTGFALLALTNPTIGVHLHGGETVAMPIIGRAPLVPWMAVLLFVCTFVVVGNVWRVAEVVKRSKTTTLGGFVAHIGFATLMAGLILSRGFEQKAQEYVQPGETVQMLDYRVTYRALEGKGLTDRDGKVAFDVDGPNGYHFVARPGMYMYDDGSGQPQFQVWPHVEKSLSHDVYFSLHPPVTEVWEKPLSFEKGETKTQDGITVTYLNPTQEGPLGSVGAKFGANLRITTQDGTFDTHPTLSITDQGLMPDLGSVGGNFKVALMKLNPGDNAVTLQMLFTKPVYPIELFYKPMTSLVWIGTGILTLGAAMSAFARRLRKPKPKAVEVVADHGRAPGFDPEHAPFPAT